MAVMWNMSLIPQIDPSGDPYSGMKAYFFDVNTTTPQIVYTDSALSIPHDHPVVANSSGRFPAVFFVEGSSHRLRTTTSADVTVDDVDGISVPVATPTEIPDSDTPPEKTITTGKIVMAWQAAAPNGFVRLNGRTIGSASSGAAERANADCEDLFIFLWDNDVNLSVSGGRGGTATGDWSANKAIALPDWRGRGPVAPDSFGNSASGRITDAELGADSDLLGAAGGDATHALTTAQLAAHNHTVNITDPGHRHFVASEDNVSTPGAPTNANQVAYIGNTGDEKYSFQRGTSDATIARSSSATTGITAASVNNGSGDPHNNLQPSIIVPFFIKL